MSNKKDIGLEEIKEAVLKATQAKENADKTDKLIEEFTKKVIDSYDPSDALEWIRIRAHELGQSERSDDLREAVSSSYFTIGYMVSFLVTVRLLLIRFDLSPRKSK